MSAVKDRIERIPCNISVQDFSSKYVAPRIPVILIGCADDWKASSWTREGLLSRYGDEVLWSTNFYLDSGSAIPGSLPELNYARSDKMSVDIFKKERFSGRVIMDVLEHNATIRVFERMTGPDPHTLRSRLLGDDKPDLASEWSWPRAMPPDLFSPTFASTDYRWVLMSTVDTGTFLHQDPPMTDAWNALISGHKVCRASFLMWGKGSPSRTTN